MHTILIVPSSTEDDIQRDMCVRACSNTRTYMKYIHMQTVSVSLINWLISLLFIELLLQLQLQ